METEDKFSTDLSSPVIGRKGNYNERHNWLKKGLVVINGEGGEGVDVFFVLQKESSDGYVLFTDQRKRVREQSGTNRCLKFVAKGLDYASYFRSQ